MPNALAREKSPYLRQHQSNPVQWLPWGDAAFERARREGKPVLLSIGYAACHWCHVMARESFTDGETAALMNKHFVSVKVDREERPDVDALYVRALQAMGKRAGWPLTMFLTPSGKPFWGGTYFPPERRGQQPGFREVLMGISEAYQSNPATAEARAAALIEAVAGRMPEHESGKELPPERVIEAAEELLRNLDPANGGLQGAPKFPYPALLRFLWNVGCRTRRKDFQDAAELSLASMIRGGIFDHIGGGFARYAVDAKWVVPHFEKMLYDNALLAHLLTEVWRANRSPLFRDAVYRTIDWMLREMKLAGGAFACSLDAESGGEEGGYYVWTEEEIDALLGAGAVCFKRAYGVTREGNFERRNVLHRLDMVANLAAADEACLARSRALLFEARTRRPPPRRDEKVLADWNGMAIAALARAAAVFDEPLWRDAAVSAFEFVTHNMASGGVLCHSWCDGELSAASILDDYANMAFAALSLYETTGGQDYLERCSDWVERCARHFSAPNGAFYYTPDGNGSLIARICDGLDTATPSANGVIAHVLARLYYLTGDDRYRDQALSTVLAFAGNIERGSFQLATLLDASQFLASCAQVAIVGKPDATRELASAAHQHAGPDNVVMLVHPGTKLPPQHPAAGKLDTGQPAAYVCAGMICSAPAFDACELRATLDAQK